MLAERYHYLKTNCFSDVKYKLLHFIMEKMMSSLWHLKKKIGEMLLHPLITVFCVKKRSTFY